MTKKFNPKQYKGKPRVYPPVPGAPNVRRLWVWEEDRSEYVPSSYEARRYTLGADGSRVRTKKSFATLEEARRWQSQVLETQMETDAGPTLESIVEKWKSRSFPRLAPGTRTQYERMLNLHFGTLLPMGIRAITPIRIDEWLDTLKDPNGAAMKVKNRQGFAHELTLLSTLVNYYVEHYEDPAYRSPVRERHREMAEPNEAKQAKKKDLPEAEFLAFRAKLLLGRNGKLMAALATVQFYQALRVSEAAGLYWEDVALNEDGGTLYVRRYVYWPRRKDMLSEVRLGFKNAKANGGLKESPLMSESLEALKRLRLEGATSNSKLVFTVDGTHLDYRCIQYAYDQAFKAAGLPYTGTHVMRHGGARRVLNETGDLSLAQQLLGNTDMRSTLVYAKRDKAGLRAYANGDWENPALVANGRRARLSLVKGR